MRKTSKKGGLKGFICVGVCKTPVHSILLTIAPRTPEGGQSVKATFLMRKTSKKGGLKGFICVGVCKTPVHNIL